MLRLHLVMAHFKHMRLNAVRVQRAWRDHAFRTNVLRVALFEQRLYEKHLLCTKLYGAAHAKMLRLHL
eukprot:4581357-Prymnesium_polylepis.1